MTTRLPRWTHTIPQVYPRRRNVTTLMVGLKKRSHTQKSHPKVVNPRDIAGERKNKKQKKSHKSTEMAHTLPQVSRGGHTPCHKSTEVDTQSLPRWTHTLPQVYRGGRTKFAEMDTHFATSLPRWTHKVYRDGHTLCHKSTEVDTQSLPRWTHTLPQVYRGGHTKFTEMDTHFATSLPRWTHKVYRDGHTLCHKSTEAVYARHGARTGNHKRRTIRPPRQDLLDIGQELHITGRIICQNSVQTCHVPVQFLSDDRLVQWRCVGGKGGEGCCLLPQSVQGRLPTALTAGVSR